jgi:molybdopterin-binding protein
MAIITSLIAAASIQLLKLSGGQAQMASLAS